MLVHGDDFTLLGSSAQLDWFKAQIANMPANMKPGIRPHKNNLPIDCLLYTSDAADE